MEAEVLDALESIGYDEIKLDESNIEIVLQDPVSFSKILTWICCELKAVSKLEEGIKPMKNLEDLESFYMDLSSLLKELGCTNPTIMLGKIKEKFNTPNQRLYTVSFLATELQSLRILHIRKPEKLKAAMERVDSEQASILRAICQTIGLPKPPNSIDSKSLFSKIEERLAQIQSKVKPTDISYKPLFTGLLSPKQWTELEELNVQLSQEYQLRREMLLKRLDVTVESFHWSDKLKDKKQTMSDVFCEHRSKLNNQPNVTIGHLLAARTDLLFNEKTSSGSAREHTKSAVNDFLIGKVPDRGGRPEEAQPPPPEMPAWQQRSGPPAASGSVGWIPNSQRGGGGRGGPPPRRGGNYQHGDNQQHGEYHQQPYGGRGHQGGSYQQRGGFQQQQHQGDYQQGDYRDHRGGFRGGRGASRVQGGWSSNY